MGFVVSTQAAMKLTYVFLLTLILMSDSSLAEEKEISAKIKRIVRETVAEEMRNIKDSLLESRNVEIRDLINSVITNDLEQCGNLEEIMNVEKRLTRRLDQRMQAMAKQVHNLSENQQTVINKTRELDLRIDNLSLYQNINMTNDCALEETTQNSDKLQTRVHETERPEVFKRPSFISNWILMKSQDYKLSEICIDHGLGLLPSKVEVLVKPTEGPNKGWIFHGDSAFRNDDDFPPSYGGVVYLYDETKVTLFAPKERSTSGRSSKGSIINTGSESSRRLGYNHQSSSSAWVMVKAWAPEDLPVPDFESSWRQLDVKRRARSYFDIPHGLGEYPALVVVQVMHEETGLISEGTSSSVEIRAWLNCGGTIWGFNNFSVRVWSSYLPNQNTDKGTFTYQKPIGANDGWGRALREELVEDKAKFRVLVWSQKYLESERDFFIGKANKDTFQFGPISDEHKPVDTDILTLYVEAKSGSNKGYRFKGYGGSHAKDEGFGGSVYAYNNEGKIRSWPPNPMKNGYLIHITPPYGNGKNTQISDDADLVYTMIKTEH